MPIDYTLTIIAFITSAIAGVVGFGGGMLLIAIMPMFLAPSLIIPIHGVTQLASNASRVMFSLKDVQWRLLPKFLIGSVLGVFLFGVLLVNMPTKYVPTAIGVYILLNLWSKAFSLFIKQYESFYLIGALQTGLGLLVGATGPLSLTALTQKLTSKDQIIATSAVFMTISHAAKIPIFLFVGAPLASQVNLLICLVMASTLGSFVGTKLRLAANNQYLILLIKLLLTVMALHMLINSFR